MKVTFKMLLLCIIIAAVFLILTALLTPPDLTEQASICIPAADISAEVLTADHGSFCGCCDALYNGGICYTDADMSAVSLYNMAFLTTGDVKLTLECVEIIPCVRVGHWLVSWHGVIRAGWDIVIFSDGVAYRWTIL